MDEKLFQTKGISQIEFEEQRRVIALDILKQANTFIAWDLAFNKHVSDLAEELVKQLKANPKVMASNTQLADILKDIRSDKGMGTSDISGGDFTGGNAWDDIWGVIKEILTGEKDFIKEIIIKILGI